MMMMVMMVMTAVMTTVTAVMAAVTAVVAAVTGSSAERAASVLSGTLTHAAASSPLLLQYR